tara:strand:- start:383 stop:595 length:213 start_codon:yes stop_codon:yes gene_type:complete
MTIKKQEFITEIFTEVGAEANPAAMAFAYTEKASVNEAIAVFNSYNLSVNDIVAMETYEIPQHYTANELA